MELILLLLKIILIAFFVLLGLIVLLLGLILLVPIRYEVSGSVGDSWDFKVRGKLTYLFSIFKLQFSYEEGQSFMKIFLFGFEKKSDKAGSRDSLASEAETSEETETEESSTEKQEEIPEQVTEEFTVPKEEAANISEEQTEKEGKNSEKEFKKRKQKALREKKAPKVKKEKTERKINFAFIKQQIMDEHNQSVVRKVFSEVGYLFRHFKFRRIDTDLIFTTGDPATTGQTLGVLCMIPVLYRYNFKITPDFEAEKAYVKGTFLVAGRVRLIHVLIMVLRLILDKEVRLVVKRILTLLEK